MKPLLPSVGVHRRVRLWSLWLGARHLAAQPFVRLLKSSQGALDIIWALFKRFRIPFAARRSKEISAVNMDGGGNLIQWIRNSVDYRRAQRDRVL